MDNIFYIKDLKKNFKNHKVLKGIDFSVNKGDVISILGQSGSGKSTLLRCINLLEEPSSGTILYHGKDILKEKKLNKYRTKVSMVFQSFNLFNNMSVLDNLTIGQIKVLKRDKKDAITIAEKYLKKVGMYEFKDVRPSKLSGGQKQRVSISRSLCMDPEVILFDEPTSALDPIMVNEVLNVMKLLSKEGMTMILVTHELAFARDVSNRVLFMENGVICEDSPSVEFFKNPKSKKGKIFLEKVMYN